MSNQKQFQYSDDDVVNVAVAASICALSASTLNKRRIVGGGPAYIKLGGAVRYRVGALRAWMASAQRASTAEYARRNAPAEEVK